MPRSGPAFRDERGEEPMSTQDDDPTLEQIYDALDDGNYEGALEFAAAAIEALPEGEDDPVLRFLAGVALMELDQPGDAIDQLTRATELDPDDAEFRANLALALFRTCRFADAAPEAAKAVKDDPQSPDALHARALTLEREGRLDEADAFFSRASKLDSERFPVPVRLSRDEFDRELRLAEASLSDDFRRHLEVVPVLVEDIPSEPVLLDESPPLDPELLGLFVGTALPDRALTGGGADTPPRILLFQRNLERYAADTEDLRKQIAITLYHELGHYLGLDEERLEAIDLG
jgi:predicted Zn-dependent protease with MMP-like domain